MPTGEEQIYFECFSIAVKRFVLALSQDSGNGIGEVDFIANTLSDHPTGLLLKKARKEESKDRKKRKKLISLIREKIELHIEKTSYLSRKERHILERQRRKEKLLAERKRRREKSKRPREESSLLEDPPSRKKSRKG